MRIYRFCEKQHLPLTIAQAWAFFSNPQNLAQITPPEMKFIITNDPGTEIYSGMIITYKIRPFIFVPLTWITEITAVEENSHFIDEQRFGPYKFWHHRHSFEEVSGGVLMKDDIYYSLSYGIIGRLVHSLFVEKRVKEIFNYRKAVIKQTFPGKTNTRVI